MRQVFQNLIANALKFRRQGVVPQVRIEAQRREPRGDIEDSIISIEFSEKVWYDFVVIDNGIGFEAKYAEKLFVPFQGLHSRTSHCSGPGIGLAIVRKAVERQGGSVSAWEKRGGIALYGPAPRIVKVALL